MFKTLLSVSPHKEPSLYLSFVLPFIITCGIYSERNSLFFHSNDLMLKGNFLLTTPVHVLAFILDFSQVVCSKHTHIQLLSK